MKAALVDASRWQKSVDVAAIKRAGFVGIIHRCTLGTTGRDMVNRPLDSYLSVQEQCRDLDMIFGAYHVLWPANKAPVEEANWFDKWAGDVDLMVPDVELTHGLSKNAVVDQAYELLLELERIRTEIPKVVYSGSWWWTVDQGQLEDTYDYWEAEYFKQSPRGGIDMSQAPTGDPSSLPPGWDDWIFWQWTSGGKPVGVQSESLDYNIFNGTEEELRVYLKLDAPPPPPSGETIPFEGQIYEGSIAIQMT